MNYNFPQLTGRLLAWYGENHRDLPWRHTRDPYAVWVSEIMLQQTQVKTVVPYYERFMAAFPSVHDLARAPQEKVLKAWEGLGYYSRAKNLQKAAGEICAQYRGQIPSDPDALLALPGIGPYTANAVLSISFGVSAPAVDGNVRRVASRFLALNEDITKAGAQRTVESHLTALIAQTARPDLFNQAMMELGATVCHPDSPSCPRCPWQTDCQGHLLGCPQAFPIKPPPKKKRVQQAACGMVQDPEGRFILSRRPVQGIWANLWSLPLCVADENQNPAHMLAQLLAPLSAVMPSEASARLRHVFTHRVWLIDGYRIPVDHPLSHQELPAGWVCLSLEEALAYPLPAPMPPLIQALL
ncbi:MAG: A/G-specific adenine glycosylase [Peptococcaceae bacterium]|nr:A/G-specific adenine glycosylase [Peptococcaceae bacterium]